MNKAAFLDRDGVINEEVNYLHEPDKVRIIPGVAGALRRLRENGFLIIVVTNQAGVARGMYQEHDIDLVHREIDAILARDGAKIDAYYYCPHHEKFTGDCDCRKPAPGMLLQAGTDHNIDFAASFMAGDRLSDIDAGRAAGCGRLILVRTGYGAKTAADGVVGDVEIADDLSSAVDMVLK